MMPAVASRTLKWIVTPLAREVPVNHPLCDAILKRFREMDLCPENWPNDWKLVGAPLVRRQSTVFRLSSVRGGRSICIKIVNGTSHGLDDSARLYAALRHYHARSDFEQGFTVPEPYGWVPEHAAVIMEWVEGQTFSEILKRELFLTKRRHANIRKVAGWLRWFHLQSEVESGPLANSKQLKGIVKVFDEAQDLSKAAMAHDPALRKYLEVASNYSGLLRGAKIDFAVLHGDFKPTNLLISHSGLVVGIDFMGRKRGPVSHDICRFLSDLDFFRNLLGRSSAVSPRFRSNDFDAFLSAYGGRAEEIARPTFLYLYFLTILSTLVNQRKKFKRGAAHMIRLAVVRSIAKQLSHELSKETRPAVAKPNLLSWLNLPRIPIDWGVAIWESDLIGSFL